MYHILFVINECNQNIYPMHIVGANSFDKHEETAYNTLRFEQNLVIAYDIIFNINILLSHKRNIIPHLYTRS